MELLFNIFLALFLIVFFLISMTFEGITISTDKIGPEGFPQMVIIISAFLLFFITINTIKEIKNSKKEKFNFNDKGFRVMVVNIVLLAIYLFSLNYIGFILSTFLFSLVAIWSMGYKSKGKAVIFTIILTLSITLVFGKVFFVSLPRGIGLLRELSYLIY